MTTKLSTKQILTVEEYIKSTIIDNQCTTSTEIDVLEVDSDECLSGALSNFNHTKLSALISADIDKIATINPCDSIDDIVRTYGELIFNFSENVR